MSVRHHVIVMGAGIAGLTAAHELNERGFRVTLLEASRAPGGKARSMDAPDTASTTRRGLPAEHGFRFLPGFYKHLPDTMRRIPCGSRNVAENLVPTSCVQIARGDGKHELLAPSRFPQSLHDLARGFSFFHHFTREFEIPVGEVAFFVGKLVQLMTSCRARRYGEYEYLSWLEYIEAERMSRGYQRYLAHGMSRSLVALDPQHLSARTGGYILLQFLFDFSTRPGTYLDRVLNGPTSDVWIRPWLSYLRENMVDVLLDTPVMELCVNRRRVEHVVVNHRGKTRRLKADSYMLCVPLERAVPLLTPDVCAADPTLGELTRLQTSWMTGVFFYLRHDVPIVHGHTNYIDSRWALTSISQPQFWNAQYSPSRFGDGTAHGLLSVIISNWNHPGNYCRKAARDCSPEEVIAEVWRQLKAHLNDDQEILRDEDIVHACVAPSLQYDPTTGWHNEEPLLINTAGSWDSRPEATTQLPNLYLASDYIRTDTDLATMEAANEAARRAINSIIARHSLDLPPCELFPLEEPSILLPFQKLDELRYQAGQPVPEFAYRTFP